MVIDVSDVCDVRVVLKGKLHSLDALLVLFEGKEGFALVVEHLCVLFVVHQGRVQVIDCLRVLLHIEVALSSILEEIDIVWLFVDRAVEGFDGLFEVFQGVVAAAETVGDGCVVWILKRCLFKVDDGLTDQSRLEFRCSHVEVRDGILRIDLDRRLEVLDGMLMIAHILVDETTLDVIRQVTRNELLNLGKLLKSLSKCTNAAEHEPQVEHRGGKRATVLNRSLKIFDSTPHLLILQLLIVFWTFCNLFCLLLVAESSAMVILGVSVLSLNRSAKVSVRLSIIFQMLVHVCQIKIIVRIRFVNTYGLHVLLHCLIKVF